VFRRRHFRDYFAVVCDSKGLRGGKFRVVTPKPRTSQAPHPLSVGAHGEPHARVPHLVASRLPRRYHFRALIQCFQSVAAPFPGDSGLRPGPLSAAILASVRVGHDPRDMRD
jgi:hypothetical protein